MKRSIVFLNKEVATAAIEDAKNFSIQDAIMQEKDGQIEVSFAAYDCSPEPAKATPTWADLDNMWSAMSREMQYEMKWLREDMNYHIKRFDAHMKGHLPPILDSGKLEGALKALGLSDSYEVRKPQVSVEYY